MTITLKRYRTKTATCDGLLFIDGDYYCDTAEPTSLMLPLGTYDVCFSKHPVHHHRAPLLTPSTFNSPPSTFIIHGNGVFNAKSGDILIGEHVCPGIVICSRQYFDPLIKRLEKAFSRGTSVQLQIVSTL